MAKSTLFEISTVKMPSLQTSISPCKSLGSSFSPSDHDTEETLGFGVSIPNLSLFFHNQLTFKKLFHFAVHCMWKQLMKPSGLSFMRRTHVSIFKWYWAYLAHWHNVRKSLKMSHLHFDILNFPLIFVLIKSMSGNTVWPQAEVL